MRPRRYPYSGKKKELVKPVQIENPLTLFNQFIMSVLYNAKPNNKIHFSVDNESFFILERRYKNANNIRPC